MERLCRKRSKGSLRGKMYKTVIFGATTSATELIKEHSGDYDVVAYCDNNEDKWGGCIEDRPIISPDELSKYDYDRISIVSFSAFRPIKDQLLQMGVPEYKIECPLESNISARIRFLRDFARIANERNMQGKVAEAGVFQGEFAKEINEYFPDRELLLFDTFDGFDERDVGVENEMGFSSARAGHLNNTSEELVLGKMRFPDKVVIYKGFFPETAVGIKDRFVFVNLDMDLYKPTLEGLRLFYPLMVPGGIIVTHDYLSKGYEGVKAAVREFEDEIKQVPFPIGDGWSVAFQRKQV